MKINKLKKYSFSVLLLFCFLVIFTTVNVNNLYAYNIKYKAKLVETGKGNSSYYVYFRKFVKSHKPQSKSYGPAGTAGKRKTPRSSTSYTSVKLYLSRDALCRYDVKGKRRN